MEICKSLQTYLFLNVLLYPDYLHKTILHESPEDRHHFLSSSHLYFFYYRRGF